MPSSIQTEARGRRTSSDTTNSSFKGDADICLCRARYKGASLHSRQHHRVHPNRNNMHRAATDPFSCTTLPWRWRRTPSWNAAGISTSTTWVADRVHLPPPHAHEPTHREGVDEATTCVTSLHLLIQTCTATTNRRMSTDRKCRRAGCRCVLADKDEIVDIVGVKTNGAL